MSDHLDLYVLDTETTGVSGSQFGDKIVEIGIARVDLEGLKVYPELDMIIDPGLASYHRDAWVFHHTDLRFEDVTNSPYSPFDASAILHVLYARGVFTSYNIDFDFNRFLNRAPYFFNPKLAPDIMHVAAEVVHTGDHCGSSPWPKAQTAYDHLCPQNPAHLPDGKERHRALDDAVMEAHILLALCCHSEDIMARYKEACE